MPWARKDQVRVGESWGAKSAACERRFATARNSLPRVAILGGFFFCLRSTISRVRLGCALTVLRRSKIHHRGHGGHGEKTRRSEVIKSSCLLVFPLCSLCLRGYKIRPARCSHPPSAYLESQFRDTLHAWSGSKPRRRGMNLQRRVMKTEYRISKRLPGAKRSTPGDTCMRRTAPHRFILPGR